MGQRRNISNPSQQFANDNKTMVLGAATTQKDITSGNYIYLNNNSYLFWDESSGSPGAFLIMSDLDVLTMANYVAGIDFYIATATAAIKVIRIKEDPVTAEDVQVTFPDTVRITAGGKVIIDHNGTYAYTYVPLASPLTSTSWDGDSKTSANDGILDLSSVFSAPAGIKAASVRMSCQAGTVGHHVRLGPSDTYDAQLICRPQATGVTADAYGTVNCDANGDFYVTINGSPTSVYIEIWGYYI